MIQELNRVTVGLLIGFAIIALTLVFWSVIRSDTLLARDDNARNVIAEQAIQRGTIFDADGGVLAYSEADEQGIMQRIYPVPAAGAVGYYNFTYGTAGIEDAYNSELRGEAWLSDWETLVDDVLHRSLRGGDVRATVDLDVQQAAAAALGQRGGAVIVVEVPSGRVLAMISQPGFDPNTLEDNWKALTRDEATSPLLNRVTAGLYQPGGALQTVILAAQLASYSELEAGGAAALNVVVPDAQAVIMADGVQLACLPGTPAGELTLAEAYVYGCPAAFAHLLDEGALTPGQVWDRFGVLGLLAAPELAGYAVVIDDQPPHPLTANTPLADRRAALVGQGDLTVTPLHMVQVIAAVANRGRGVPLHLVDAVRPPDTDTWQPVAINSREPALLRADVAAALRLAMVQAAAQSPYVSQARRGTQVLYGHTALSYAGPPLTPYAWFLGFIDLTVGDDVGAIAAVVVIADEDDPGAAAQVAGAAFGALDQAGH